MPLIIRISAALFALAIAIACGVMMYNRYQVQELWGYLPMGLLLGSMFAVWVFSLRKDNTTHLRHSAMAAGSGILFYLGFPPLPFTPLIMLAFIPLFVIQRELEDADHPKAGKRFFGYCFAAFLLWNILSTFWVANASLAAGIFANIANALLMSIPLLLWHHTRKQMSGSVTRIALVCYWLTFEYLHFRWDLSWPWLTVGNSWSQYTELVQWYEFTGVLGGTLWILMTNVFLFRLIRGKYYGVIIRKKGILIALCLWLIIPVTWSLVLYNFNHDMDAEAIEVIAVQPNHEPHYEQSELSNIRIWQQATKLAEPLLTENTDYLILPEATFSRLNLTQLERTDFILAMRSWQEEHPNTAIVFGSSAYKLLPKGEKSARSYTDRDGNMIYWQAYNAAFQVSANADSIPVYFKSKLVAGAEYFPFGKLLSFLEPLLEPMGISTGGNGKQLQREAFLNDGIGIGPVICYESVFGEFATGYARHGAQALFIVTNDGWWDNTPGHKQHMYFARLRAIENRRSIVRSANTGVSCFINRRGDISQRTAYREATAIRADIALNSNRTTYQYWGDFAGRIAGFVSILLLLNVLAKRLKGRVQ